MKAPKIYIGTAGWSYKDWVPNFYPKNQSKDFDWLEYYSEFFNCVEVNSSYYTYLNPKTVEGWIRKVEPKDDFLFTLKLHSDFSHKHLYTKEKIAAVEYNIQTLKEAERFGGLLIQFPYSFGCTDSNIEYLGKLIKLFDGYDKFVEVRHASWNSKKAKSITFCTIDQPQIGESIEFKPVVGNSMAYIRFHGRNEEAWAQSIKNFGQKQSYSQQNARYEYLYSPGELTEIDAEIKEIFDKVKKVFVIMNNHPHGDAVANALELIHLLKEGIKLKVPESTIKAYPRLQKLALN